MKSGAHTLPLGSRESFAGSASENRQIPSFTAGRIRWREGRTTTDATVGLVSMGLILTSISTGPPVKSK
jgi:hypothetical protein